MKAIILAAGKATRLLPLTKDFPQAMLKVGKKTILELQVEKLEKAGVDDIVVITGHLSEKLEEFCKGLGIRTLFNPFHGVSGIALTLWVAKEELKGGFMLLYSDILFDQRIPHELLKHKGDICLAIKKDGLREEAEKVTECDGLIRNVSKLPNDKQNGEFIGVAKFAAAGVKTLTEELHYMAKTNLDASFIELIDRIIIKDGVVTAYDIGDSRFVDIDFPEGLEKAGKLFK